MWANAACIHTLTDGPGHPPSARKEKTDSRRVSGPAARSKNSDWMSGYRLLSSTPYISHEPTVFSRSCDWHALFETHRWRRACRKVLRGPAFSASMLARRACSGSVLTSRSKNWLSLPYLAVTGRAALQTDTSDKSQPAGRSRQGDLQSLVHSLQSKHLYP